MAKFNTVKTPGLKRMSCLSELMGNPQKRLRCVHVAGTNGKGSVCAFLESIFAAAGVRTGKYISPHLLRINERISINGKPIPDEKLSVLLEKISELCPEVEKRTGESPTDFEIWTAAAFRYFADEGCELVILETGLGGEFDATNVIDSNAAAIITRISLDHCALLGNTIGEIAAAKSGIIKKGCPTITFRQDTAALDVISRRAEALGSRLTVADIPESVGFSGTHEKFLYGGKCITCGLGGLHQLENATLAIKAAESLGIRADEIARGIASARNPARLEDIAPSFIFDGAHNPDGARALAESLSRYFPNEPTTLVFACMKDKDAVSSLKLLAAKNRSFIFTEVENCPRSASAGELKAEAETVGIRGEAFGSVEAALSEAKGRGGLCVICGSLYLYETAKNVLTHFI